jgi:hypothetical protein
MLAKLIDYMALYNGADRAYRYFIAFVILDIAYALAFTLDLVGFNTLL